jgi:hypothetical protein
VFCSTPHPLSKVSVEYKMCFCERGRIASKESSGGVLFIDGNVF